MADTTKTAADIEYYRQWRDEHSDEQLRHRTMASDSAWLWGGDPDDLDDEQTAIYEAGYVAGQKAIAQRLRHLARELDPNT